MTRAVLVWLCGSCARPYVGTDGTLCPICGGGSSHKGTDGKGAGIVFAQVDDTPYSARLEAPEWAPGGCRLLVECERREGRRRALLLLERGTGRVVGMVIDPPGNLPATFRRAFEVQGREWGEALREAGQAAGVFVPKGGA